jgi:hypothetical protein
VHSGFEPGPSLVNQAVTYNWRGRFVLLYTTRRRMKILKMMSIQLPGKDERMRRRKKKEERRKKKEEKLGFPWHDTS